MRSGISMLRRFPLLKRAASVHSLSEVMPLVAADEICVEVARRELVGATSVDVERRHTVFGGDLS